MVIIDKNLSNRNIDFLAGTMILIDKEPDWTSFDAVAKIRGILRHKLQVKKIKVGHAGTLDPKATGLLIICTGKMTKMIDQFQSLVKQYEGQMLFGATTPSYDAESEIDQNFEFDHITNNMIIEKIKSTFIGDIEQLPPMFSAVKINGQRLYTLARKGKTVERKKRKIHVYDYKVNSDKFPNLDFDICCSKGTYIRSLVHDLGASLDSGAYMTKLRRTAIGNYNVDDALKISDFESIMQSIVIPDN